MNGHTTPRALRAVLHAAAYLAWLAALLTLLIAGAVIAVSTVGGG